jgi:hypothetical protein
VTTPDPHAIAMMALTVLALYLFTRDRIPLELTSLGLVAVLAMGFALFPYGGVRPADFFTGFGHEALIAVCALMVLGQGLVRTVLGPCTFPVVAGHPADRCRAQRVRE